MTIENFDQLVSKVNESLGSFCQEFAYRRKVLAKLGKAPARDRFFKFDPNSERDWAINEGGGTEIQFHLYLREGVCGYGLGFNAQYVPFKTNEKSAKDFMRPFAEAYMKLKNCELVQQLKNDGFLFLYGKENELPSFKDDYYLFGKKIELENGNELKQHDFDCMISDIRGRLFSLYCAIFNLKTQGDSEMTNTKPFVDLLRANHNLVLTGAPGTGKTYLARQVAMQMILGKPITDENDLSPEERQKLDDQMEFVQFHPSFDYTDFVEGLRPVKSEDGQSLGFERRDGVFKAFCKRAIQGAHSGHVDNFDAAWNALMEELKTGDDMRIDVPNISGQGSFPISLNEPGTGLASRQYNDSGSDWIRGKSKFFTKSQLYNIYKGEPGVPSGGHDNYRKAIIEFLKTNYHLKDYAAGETTTNLNPCVFIVDEINRGDISKIFGELFFAIDGGYRGPKGNIKTQYQNLVEKNDLFFDGFYVPENVYIIGTMNDIDRNVESMDFAIRRRFAWKEIDPAMRFDAMWADLINIPPTIKDKARQCMIRVNEVISNPETGLGPAFQIGPSYFRELNNYQSESDGGFASLWNNHIEPLVREYLRGVPHSEPTSLNIKNAFFGTEQP